MSLFSSTEKIVAQNTPLSWQDIQLRPTRLGVGLLVIAISVWIGALNYAINLAYMLSFWIGAFFIMAYLMSSLQLLGLKNTIHLHGELFVGDEADIALQFSAISNRYRAFIVNFVEDQAFVQSENNQIPHALFAIFTHKRGYLSLPKIKLSSSAPFGLIQAKVTLQNTTQVLVYPKPVKHPLTSTHSNIEQEGTTNTQKGGDDLAYLNEYQQGESLQRVAWKVFAKQGKLLSKSFESNYAHPPDIISYQDYPNNTSIDALASFLCYRVLQAEKNQKNYTLVLPRETILPSPKQRALALSALSLL